MRAAFATALGLGVGAFLLAEAQVRAEIARRSRILRTPRGDIEVEVTGTGPDVLVLHGAFGGFDQGTWMARTLGLGAHRVIAVSRPGYLRTPDLVTIDEAVALYVAALDAVGSERVAVIGGSAGGMSAWLLARRHPERVSRLVLISAVSGRVFDPFLPPPLFMARASTDANSALLSAIRRPDQRALGLEGVRTLAAADRRVRGAWRDLAISRAFVPPAGVTVPTLVIHGKADRTVPFAHAERSLAGCANGELIAIEGGGHLCNLTHAEVGEGVRAFLGGAQSASGTNSTS